MESLTLMCLLSFPSFDLSCYYHLLPAVRCSAVTVPQETRGQTDAGVPVQHRRALRRPSV